MAKVGAQRAAELTGKSKSTIQRAMNAGKLSFEVDANQRRLIDVSELERVFGISPQGEVSRPSIAAPQIDTQALIDIELERARHAIEVERLKMEVRMAQDQADQAQNQIEDLKVQRDLWQKQAQQILITSQYSQKQAEERIHEMQLREEARKAQAESRRMQQGAVNHTPRTASQPARPVEQTQQRQAFHQQARDVSQQQAQEPRAQDTRTQEARPQPEAQPQNAAHTPVFRTVQTGNQNRTAAAAEPAQRTSLFATLFGKKKRA